MMSAEKDNKSSRIVAWIKKLGFWGFMFFLVKGLIWLAVTYWLVK